MVSNWKHGDVQVGDMIMHYVRTGGKKPALVLAHGFTDNGMCWLPVGQVLSMDYDVILPDARGHGLSSRLQPGERINHAEDLAGFIQALGLDQPIVGGHSMGGVTASMLGAHHPELVRALILEDPAWVDPLPKAKELRSKDDPWRQWLESLPSKTVEEVMAKGRADNPTWPEIEMLPWAESKKQLDVNVFRIQDIREDWKEVARQISMPTLLITGDPDRHAIITPEVAQNVQKWNPMIQVAHIPGVGHNIRRENFQMYMDAVQAFLKKI